MTPPGSVRMLTQAATTAVRRSLFLMHEYRRQLFSCQLLVVGGAVEVNCRARLHKWA